MKKNTLLCIILNCSFLIFQSSAQPGSWTWMHGSSVGGSTGNFGTQGIPSPTNEPPAMYESAEFKDLQGNFWMFGGLNSGYQDYGDLWKYDPAINQWTWIKGNGTINSPGNFGIQGVPALSNFPSARSWGVASWVDLNGDFWIYGGYASNGIMSDLWKYTIVTNTWTWMQGSSNPAQVAVYGTLGIPGPNLTPGSRYECNSTWVDNNNNLWLLGGYTGSGNLNDLWKYDPLINQWAYMKGANFTGQPGTYGTMWVPNVSNVPGARQSYCHWKDGSGRFWFFGGQQYPNGSFNDMWMFDPVTNNWTWMSGANVLNDNGNYGTPCLPSISNLPPARFENRCFWTDNNGNFWLYGGGRGTSFQTGYGDLWMFNPVSLEWTFVSGDVTTNTNGVYGTLGIPSLANKPGCRSGAIGWFDAANNYLFLIGGTVNGWPAPRNDLWRYEIDSNCPQVSGVLPVANFSSDSVICQNACINFNNVSLNATSFQWTFTGAQTQTSTLSNPTNICYAVTGNYDVELIACNNNGCDTVLFSSYIQVDSLPTVNLGSDTLICIGDSIVLDAGTGFNSYLWNTGSTSQTLAVNAQGTYSVEITSGACSSIDTIIVSTQSCANIIVNLSSTDTSFCEKQCIDFFDLSTNNPTSWQWHFAGAMPDTSTLQNPTNICYNNYGSFDVTLIACNSFGCDTLTFANFINEFQNPVDSIYSSNDTIWSLPYLTYQWFEVTSGILSGETNQYFIPTQLGSYYCVVSDSIGCVATSNTITLTGTADLMAPKGRIQIIPNPSDGSFTLQLLPKLQMVNCQIQIINVMGEIIFERNIKNVKAIFSVKIDLNKHAKGIYFLRLNDGIEIRSLKLIIK